MVEVAVGCADNGVCDRAEAVRGEVDEHVSSLMSATDMDGMSHVCYQCASQAPARVGGMQIECLIVVPHKPPSKLAAFDPAFFCPARRTGKVWNVTKRSIGVEINKQVRIDTNMWMVMVMSRSIADLWGFAGYGATGKYGGAGAVMTHQKFPAAVSAS